jgi:molybdenum cofactor cytidylyltransferase
MVVVKMITAIILAAGTSSRMGRTKQLLKAGDSTLIRTVTENVLASAVDEVLVVTGYRHNEVSAAINDLPVQIIFNPRYEAGQGTSLALGVNTIAVNTNISAFLVFMADQPLISASLINVLIEEFQKRNCQILRPVYDGLPGHPVIFSYSLCAKLKNLAGDVGARQVLKRLEGKVEFLPVQDKAVVFDIDTPESYKEFITKVN